MFKFSYFFPPELTAQTSYIRCLAGTQYRLPFVLTTQTSSVSDAEPVRNLCCGDAQLRHKKTVLGLLQYFCFLRKIFMSKKYNILFAMLFHTREGTYVIGLEIGTTRQERPSYCNLMLHSGIKPLHTNTGCFTRY